MLSEVTKARRDSFLVNREPIVLPAASSSARRVATESLLSRFISTILRKPAFNPGSCVVVPGIRAWAAGTPRA
jgi:hypothetical protein